MFESLGWAIAIILLLLILRALAWHNKHTRERRQYTQGIQALYESFTHEADPKAIARGKVRLLYSDANFILTRAHQGKRHSRRVMKRYGMSQRRWNSAHKLLKEIGALPLGQCSRKEAYRRLRERARQLHKAASVVQVLPFE